MVSRTAEHVDSDFEEVIERHAEYAVVAVPDDLVRDLSRPADDHRPAQ